MSNKIWFWVFLAMFAVPEVLWSPVGNVVYGLLQNSNDAVVLRQNFLMQSDNVDQLLMVLTLQFIGILLSFIFLLKKKTNTFLKIFLALVFMVLIFTTGFVLYIGFSLRHGVGF